MKSYQGTKTSKDIITPEKKTDISLSSVKLIRTWAFWESYINKSNNIDYDKSNKFIFKWDDLITFFQFWNSYPGNNIKNIFFDGSQVKYFFQDKNRINSMNIFEDGIKPMWEDEKNKGGKYFQCDYQIQIDRLDKFIELANYHWKKLILETMGGIIPHSDSINGLRFVDKTDFKRGKKILFRIEIWIRKDLEESNRNELKEYLKKNLECESINVKDII